MEGPGSGGGKLSSPQGHPALSGAGPPTPGCRGTYRAISNCSSHFFFSSRVLKKSS